MHHADAQTAVPVASAGLAAASAGRRGRWQERGAPLNEPTAGEQVAQLAASIRRQYPHLRPLEVEVRALRRLRTPAAVVRELLALSRAQLRAFDRP